MKSATCQTLTKKQEAVVALAVDPSVTSHEQIAKKLGMNRQNVGRMIRYDHVGAELTKRGGEQLDKARGVIHLAESQLRSFIAALDKADTEHLDVETMSRLAVNATAVYSKMLELRERYSLDQEDAANPKAVATQLRQGIAWGIKLGRGLKVLGCKGKA